MVRHRKPPSQNWRTFLDNHLRSLVSVDFFTVPTVRFQVLYVFLVLAHDWRRILHFGVTAHPTAEWTAQQLREEYLGASVCAEGDFRCGPARPDRRATRRKVMSSADGLERLKNWKSAETALLLVSASFNVPTEQGLPALPK